MDVSFIIVFAGLKALVLSNNEIVVTHGIAALRELDSLVLSHNSIESLSIKHLVNLRKLSLSYNKLTKMPDTSDAKHLKDMRLSSNMISTIPEAITLNAGLCLLDLGHNQIESFEYVV